MAEVLAWLRHMLARIECAAIGRHVPPRDGVARGYRVDYFICDRCHDPVAVERGPK